MKPSKPIINSFIIPFESFRAKVKMNPYVFAFLVLGIGLLLEIPLNIFLQQGVYLLLIISLFLAGWYGGFLPSLTVTIVGFLIADYFFLPPTHTFFANQGEYIRAAIFFTEGILFGLVGESRKRWEKEINKSYEAEKKALQNREKAEKRFHVLANNIPNLAWMAKGDGHVFWFNSRWYEYTGTTKKQMEGSGWKLVHDAKILPGILKKWKTSIKTEEPFEMIFPLRGKDGVFRPFLSRAIPVRDKSGRVLYWFGTNTDITKQKEIEKRKDDFIALASHELKTPLTSTKILTQILKKRFAASHDASELLQKMDNQIDKLTELITEMLDISRSQQGKLFIRKDLFSLRIVVEGVVKDLQQVTKHRLVLEWTTQEYFLGDKDRIRQVLINLITNAIKYSPENKDIIIQSEKKDGFVMVSITDYGIGIAKQEQEHIFDRFYQAQTNKENTYPGLGLGLYITKEIVENMGGKIWVESEENKGSTFYFTLPIHKIKELNK